MAISPLEDVPYLSSALTSRMSNVSDDYSVSVDPMRLK